MLANSRSGRAIYVKRNKNGGTWDQFQKPLKLKFSLLSFSRTQKDSLTLLIYTLSLYKRLINLKVSNVLKKNLNQWCIFPSLTLFYVTSEITHLLIDRETASHMEQKHASMFSARTGNIACMVTYFGWIGAFLHLFAGKEGVESTAFFYIHSSKTVFLTDCYILFKKHTANEVKK